MSMIRPIESLLLRVKEVVKDNLKRLEIEKEVAKLIENVYFNDVFWVEHPAKVAFCIVLVVLEGRVGLEEIDKERDLIGVIERNEEEIAALKERLRGMKGYNRKESGEEGRLEMYREWTKQYFQKPVLKRMNNSIGSVSSMTNLNKE